jgi:hypothetical protein
MKLVEIAKFQNPIGAEIARGRLQAAGIDAVLFDHGFASALGGAFTPSRLMVPESTEAAARAILEEAAE